MIQQHMNEEKLLENQEDIVDEILMIPTIEEKIPLPKSVTEALPELSTEEELEVMANTIKLVADLANDEIKPSHEDILEAKDLAQTMISHPEQKIQLKKYKNSTLASLAGMVAELNTSVVDDLTELKNFVVNGLIKEAVTAEKSRERITALRNIGEVDGVNAFKKHTEVVHTNISMDEIEDKLKTLVNRIHKRLEEKEVKGQVIDNGSES